MSDQIKSILEETRHFPPPQEFQSQARIKSMSQYDQLWQYARDEPEAFWDEQSQSLLSWSQNYHSVLKWEPPHAQWFLGGKINASYNCIDRHLEKNADKVAIHWEGEPGDQRSLSYKELHKEVCQCANALKSLGISAGDRVSLYMPMVPELAIAVLACARIGAVHSVVFAGFSAEALAERNRDADSKLIITADGLWRKGRELPLKATVDLAHELYESSAKTLVLQRTGSSVEMKQGRDYWWHELVSSSAEQCEAEGFDSEHPLFILYTSGSTGKPKGILHSTAGYLLGATLSSRFIFDLRDEDIFWCTADIGWITGHSYVVYGPLSNGATILMYEGAPMQPHEGRYWELIERYKVSIFYTAPTAIRAFMKCSPDHMEKYDRSSLRLLGTVGEPINPEAWMWYRETVGESRCPIVDTWWQTETGSIMISPLPGATTSYPGSATRPFFGVVPDIVDSKGQSLGENEGGYLVITQPWPSMLRGIYGDDQRYQATYWSQYGNKYFTGDGARRDSLGNYWIMGRVDDVLNVSGHRLSTMEIESALVSHEKVVEAAVVGCPDPVRGEGIACFVILKKQERQSIIEKELCEHVCHVIGKLARPDKIFVTENLPKTRSGKIMRRLLRDIAAGREVTGDTTSLEDQSTLTPVSAL